VPLYKLSPHKLASPVLVAAFDSWIDAGSASTTAAAALLVEGGSTVATFDPDQLYDYRARRPVLEIVDGRPAELTWPELTLRHGRVAERDVLVLSGPEPDFRWRKLATAILELVERLEVVEWISTGSIPAAVPHTRPVPILGTESRPGLLRGGVEPGPSGLLRVPAAAISVLEMAVAKTGIPTLGYFTQVPHYVTGAYPAAAVELVRAVGRHLGGEPSLGSLPREARELRSQLDAAAATDETTRAYVTRLESMVDEARQPAGEDLISEIERFLRDRGAGDVGRS
jgi:hypothetical protein